ncbi:hypothetical protein Pst134EB_029965 [Puccinia striiformis f. sp. tritici]|nr:hypothetical protein Pst134EB_029965 [Puccinia striiformis f. sp. tritici]
MDLTQDSDEENAKVTKKPRRKMKNGESELDDVGAFFHPPTFASEKDSEATMFKCRWCHNTYKKARGTRCNLYKHRDGDLTRAACSARNEAISAGAKLPLTPKEIKDREMDQQRGAMAQFVQSTAFEAGTFNRILVMWLIRHTLPWSRIEDLLLGIAFNYVRQGVKLYSCTWAATEAHNLYCNLQGKVLSILETNGLKLSLIHDVWTTKGNRQAFLGISAVYVSADWVFKIVHLGLKYISWTHKGKYLAIPFTTDSGSNNGTMAAEVDRLIHQKTGINMNMSENRIRCICHKFALILNAGLKVIAITPKGLVASKESTLGFVPGLSAISEEFHEIEETERFEEEVFIEDDDVDSETDSSSDTEEAPGNTNRIDSVLKKVDFIVQKVTSSAAKRSEFDTWAKKLDYSGPGLIAGHGIRWNIKFQSRDRAFKARNVINKLIENERDRQEREGGKNHFNDFKISRNDWEIVKKLNDILSEFYFLTKKMEGDVPSASMMLAEYRYLQDYLRTKLASTPEPEFQSMIRKMLSKTAGYVSEALNCDAILLASVFNPCYRLSMINLWYPSHAVYVQGLLEAKYQERKIEYESKLPKAHTPAVGKKSDRKHRIVDEVDFFPDAAQGSSENKLTVYISGRYKLPTSEASNCLTWWKVRIKFFWSTFFCAST